MCDVVWLATTLLDRWSEVDPPRLGLLFDKKSVFSNTLVKDIMVSPVRKFSPFHPHFVGSSLFRYEIIITITTAVTKASLGL